MTSFISVPATSRRHVLIAIVWIVFSGVVANAHDMWIEPTAFRTEVGSIIGARLKVGRDFLGDPILRDAALIDQFFSLDASGRKPLIGRDGADPAGMIRVAEPGIIVLGYQSNPRPVELAAENFNQYLKEEGLESIAAIREARHQTSNGVHELFSRCAKSLVSAGTGGSAQADRRIGFTLELVAERNPYTLGAGEELPVSLTYEGKPLAGALVVAINRFNPEAKLTARSDSQGRVRFRLSDRGAWLIKAVHMVPASAGTDADWRSYWASLTFELKASGAGK